MKFHFLDYQQDLFQKAIKSDGPKVYIFDNFYNLQKAKEYYNIPFLQKQSIFITLDDLKEKLFPADRLILREEKLAVLFYEVLSDEEKKNLQIDDYFDAIDLANEFLKFFSELNEYNVKSIDLSLLRDWQREKYNILQSIREKYVRKLDELNYTDRTLAFDFENFDSGFLKDYRELVFVNIINFTPKERDLVRKLEGEGKRIELYLQVSSQDYDKVNLTLRSLTLPEESQTNIKLFQTEEDLLQIVNVLCKVEKLEKCTILDADFTNNDYHRLLSSGRINVDKEFPFTEAKIFRFLENIFDIYSNSDRTGKEIKLELGTLLKAFSWQEFREYYGLNLYSLKNLQKLASEEYVYLTLKMAEENGLAGLKKIFDDIEEIGSASNLIELCSILENLNFKKLNDRYFSTNISQFFGALQELVALEEMNIVSTWDRYFSEKARGLFRLILNYLRFKRLKKISGEKEICVLRDLLTAGYYRRENLIIMNATKGIIPSESTGSFLLTEKQRKELGLKSATEKRLEEKYYFFRHVFSSKRAFIFSLNNIENNTTSSSFVDEIKIKYGIKPEKLPVEVAHYPAVTAKIFPSNGNIFIKDISSVIFNEDGWPVEKEDFPARGFSFGYYKYKTLKKCFCRFYLEMVARLEEEKKIPQKQLSRRIIGTFVHKIFEDIIGEVGVNFETDKKLVQQFVKEKFAAYDLKVNVFYKRYYRDVLLKAIENSIIYFFHQMKERIDGDIKDLMIEWQPESEDKTIIFENDLTSFYLNGRVDLLVDSGKKKYIVDFKTGGGDTEQLDFYSLMVNPDLSEDQVIEKLIYDVMKERFKDGYPGSEAGFAKKMKEDINELFEGGEYNREYKYFCRDCPYLDICRVVVR